MKPKKYHKVPILVFLTVAIMMAAPSLWAQKSSFDLTAGKFGGSFILSKERPEYAVTGNLVDFSATHGPSGLGIEISPIAFRMEPFSEYTGISLVNVTVFHRTFKNRRFQHPRSLRFDKLD